MYFGELDLDDAYFGYHVKLILTCGFIIKIAHHFYMYSLQHNLKYDCIFYSLQLPREGIRVGAEGFKKQKTH